MGKPEDKHKKKKWRNIRHNLRIIKKIKKYGKVNKKKKRTCKPLSLTVPEIMDLNNNYDETMDFFTKIRKCSTIHSNISYLDFTKIKQVTSEAALILVSELYRYKKQKCINLAVRDFNKWDERIKIQFYEMGIFELLNIKNLPKNFQPSSNDKVQYIKFRVSYISDEEVMQFQEDIKKLVNIPNQEYLHNSITEAIINVRKHAYRSNMQYKPPKNYWWAIASFDRENCILSILVFDHGIGIPATLEHNYPELYKKRFLGIIKYNKTPKDSEIIKVAMEAGKTSTNEKNRGRGSQDIKDYIAKTPNSMLKIRSLKGTYEYHTNGKEKIYDNKDILQGTLLEWNVYMEK